MDASIVDLRYRMIAVLRAVDRGETVTILYCGKQKARLTPPAPASEPSGANAPRAEDQPLFGLWKDRDDLADPASYLRTPRHPRLFLTLRNGEKRRGAGKRK